MRKGFVAALVLMSFLLVSFASSYPGDSYTLTKDWGSSSSLWPDYDWILNIAYNENAGTGHIYCNMQGRINIVNEADGSLDDTDYPIPGDYDRLSSGVAQGFFAVAQADDGVIYAYDRYAGPVLHRWANEYAVPTSQTVAGLSFTRGMKASGSGVNTFLVCVGAADNGPGQILTTSDGSTFVLAETIPLLGKSDVGIKDANTLFGYQPWGAQSTNDYPNVPFTQGWPDRWDKIGANWVRSLGFVPPVPPLYSWSYSTGGDWIECDPSDPRYGSGDGLAVYYLYYPYTTNPTYVLNDSTGAVECMIELGTIEKPGENFLTYAGGMRVNNSTRKVYYGARARDGAGWWGHVGRYSLNYVGSGVSDWELY
jgi:hypothetical protein